VTRQAVESLDLEQTEERLAETQQWTDSILARLAPYLPDGSLDILDVGAAQGRSVLALRQRGHRAAGVEPSPEAIEISRELAERYDTPLEIREGGAEQLPFEDERFDLVIATSVIEHVSDLDRSLREIHRVLRPNGIFWFNAASSMSPRQAEISVFPLFGWYPLAVKRRIMWWAVANRPAWVGHTEHPAINWFTPWSARRALVRAGFVRVWDRWDLYERQPTRSGKLVELARRSRAARIAGDVVVAGCSYAAQKRSGGSDAR